MTQEEIQNCEGLTYLTWDMFDSPDTKGSGYRFMEREPVMILDRVVHKTKMKPNIELAYVSKTYADRIGLLSFDSHRVGLAVRIRIVSAKKRMKLVKALIEEGVTRIALSYETVYYDTDNAKQDELRLVDIKNVLKPL